MRKGDECERHASLVNIEGATERLKYPTFFWFAPTIERDNALSPDALKLRCPSQFTARYLYLAVASSKALSICSSSTLPALPPPQVRFLSARPSTPPFGLAGKRWCAQDQIPTVRGQKTRRQDCLPPVT